jgi:DNA-binding transcriptional ArsR family regulator/uncharacterized protein YndB with AHSA1/START domain
MGAMAPDRTLAAVLEPRRRAILRLLAERPRSVGDLASSFDVSRPAISQHLAVLREAGLVTSETRAGRSTYRVVDDGIRAGRHALVRVSEDLPGSAAAGGVPAAPAPPVPDVVDADAVMLAVPVALTPAEALAHFTDADLLPRWLGERAELDPRAGGVFRVELGGGDVAAGTYLEVDPPQRVVFTWGAEGVPGEFGPGTSRVEIDVLTPDGGTVVRLAHHALPPWARGAHLATWARQLATLAGLSGGRPTPGG